MASVHTTQPQKITYYRIIKNASVMVSHWFRGLVGEYNRLNSNEGIYVDIQDGLLYLSEVKRDEHFTFTVVRNPWARIYDAYKDLTQMTDIKAQRELMQLNGWKTWPSFDEFMLNLDKFVTWPGDNWKGAKSITVTPQSELIDTDIDLIAKFETMVEDLQPIVDMFGVDFPLFPYYDDMYEYRNHYTDETKDIIAKFFKKDIEKWNYNF
jgi:hypothetical protein